MPREAKAKKPPQRKLWKDVNMIQAMNAVRKGGMTCCAAAKKFEVPQKSLENRIKG